MKKTACFQNTTGVAVGFHEKNSLFSQAVILNPGEALTTDSVGSLIRAELKIKGASSTECGVATIDFAGGDRGRRRIPIKKQLVFTSCNIGIRRRPTLPDRYQSSTIGTEGLNFCVRYGNRWNPFVIATGNGELFNSNLTEPVRFRTKASQVVSIPSLRRETTGPFSRPYLPLSGPSDASRPDNRIEFRFKFLTFTN